MPTSAAFIISLARRIHARAGEEAGLTLIEVVVTALILALVSAATAVALVSTIHATGDQQLRSQANAIAAQDQERLRALTDEQLSNLGASGSSRTVVVSGTSFQVTSTAVFQDAQGNSSCSSTAVDYFKATTTVNWNESYHAAAGQTQTLSEQALLSRPVIGNLASAVTDQTGAGVSGVTVAATPQTTTPGQSTVSAITDGSGCALMTSLSATTYNLSLAKANYVDFSDATPTAKTASVTASGTPTTVSAVMGLAGTINASFTTYNSAAGEANAISFSGAGNTLSSPATLSAPTTPATTASSSLTATSLFPFNKTYGTGTPTYTNNWSVYAGSCAVQAPPPASLTQYTVGPGQTASTPTGLPASAPSAAAGVQEPFLKLATISGSVPLLSPVKSVQPTDIVLTYSGGGCTDRYKASIATPASGTGVGATAPANGWLANPGQPYAPTGDLSVCADYAYTVLGVTTWYAGTVAATNTSMTGANTVPAITLGLGSRCAGAS